MSEAYECLICGYTSSYRHEFVEFLDTVKLPKVVEKARSRGRSVNVSAPLYICLKCSLELYQEEVKEPRSIRVVCPRCGEVVDVWL